MRSKSRYDPNFRGRRGEAASILGADEVTTEHVVADRVEPVKRDAPGGL
jgi:hypothetical protein